LPVPFAALAAVSAVLAGTVLFPAFLPYIPTQDFSTKRADTGTQSSAIPFALPFGTNTTLPSWANAAGAAAALLIIPAVVAYFCPQLYRLYDLHIADRGEKEIFRYVPVMALMVGAGVAIGIALGISRLFGVI